MNKMRNINKWAYRRLLRADIHNHQLLDDNLHILIPQPGDVPSNLILIDQKVKSSRLLCTSCNAG